MRDLLFVAAVRGYDATQSTEQLAQVALSCRRFLERLADALYPPKPAATGDRALGKADYKNRLWAYVDEKLSGAGHDAALASLHDVGRRIDRLADLANEAVHRPRVTKTEVQRLLMGLVMLTYDLLMLAPPPRIARAEPYEEGLRRFMEEAFEDDE